MDSISLHLVKRETAGKKNRALRRTGVTPAHVFGHELESLAVEGPTAELEKIIGQAGTSRLVNLKVGAEKKARTVLIREIQRKPGSHLLLHVDFYQVSSKQKMTVDVPVRLVGQAPAIAMKLGTLVVDLGSLSVECLPADLPARFDVDITGLKKASDAIRVGEIVAPAGVIVLNDPALVVVKIEEERKPLVEEAEVKAAVEEEKPAAEARPGPAARPERPAAEKK
jgi:large subunit ribosomal protein L25